VLAIEPVQAAEMSSKEKRIADKKAKYKSKKAAAMSQPVYKKLQKAQVLIEEKKYSEALTELASIRSRKKRLSSYESAQSWNVTAYVYYLQENHKQAINAYNKLLEQSDLPEALTQSTLKTVSQLYFIEEDYKKALATIQKLIAILESPSADVYMLHGQAHFQLKNYNKALPQIKKAVALYHEQGRTPKENWLLLLRVIYHEQSDYKNMRIVLEDLLELYPKDRYMQSLAGVYSELGDTHKQLTMMESLYERGYKQSSGQIINLANLYLLHGTPYKAAKVLQEGIEVSERVKRTERNYRLLSQAWYQAREDEKSIPPMREAASLSKLGELYIRIAQAYMNLDNYGEAENAIKQALNKGGLKRNDTAELMLGMALFNQKKLKQASVHFKLAQKDKRSEKTAGQWIAYVKEEIRRNDLLKAADL
jgi:tetratricopeptide (TPR) repeat protein